MRDKKVDDFLLEYKDSSERWFDQKECIFLSLADLKSFNELIRVRKSHELSKNGGLKSWVVLGLFVLNGNGSAYRLLKKTQDEVSFMLPEVILLDDAVKLIELYQKRSGDYVSGADVLTWSMLRPGIPSEGKVCAACGKEWTIESLRDIEFEVCSMELSFPEEIGKRNVYEVLDDMDMLYPEKQFSLSSSVMLDNGSTLSTVTTDHLIQENESYYVNYVQYLHSSCKRKKDRSSNFSSLLSPFYYSGMQVLSVDEVENDYNRDGLPWIKVTTDFGVFIVGKRRDVVQLKMVDYFFSRFPNFEELFKDEDVAKGMNYIHCLSSNLQRVYLEQIVKWGKTIR